MTSTLDLFGVDLLALVKQDVPKLRQKTKGGKDGPEWCGPAPPPDNVAADDDGFIVWPNHSSRKGKWMCRPSQESGDAIDYLVRYRNMTMPEAIKHLGVGRSSNGAKNHQKPRSEKAGPVVEEYIYTSADGQPVGRVTRHHLIGPNENVIIDPKTGKPKKTFRAYRANGKGGWRKGKWSDKVPFNLHRFDQAGDTVDNPIHLVAGEQKAIRMGDKGYVATSLPFGESAKWDTAYNEHFAGKHIVIWTDNNQTGRDDTEKKQRNLLPVCASLRLPELPGLKENQDIYDWLADHTTADLNPIIREAEILYPPRLYWRGDDLLSAELPAPRWAVPEVLPVGLGILAGRPKQGKSVLMLQIAHAVASGGQVFDQAVEQGEVLYLALEDTLQRMQERMLKQAFTKDAARNMMIITKHEGFDPILQGGANRIRTLLGMGDFRLVVIDTLGRVSGRAADNQDYGQMTDLLDPLQQIAFDFNLALVVVDHHRKSARFDADTIDDIIGATSKAGVADSVLGLFGKPGKAGATLKITGRDVDEIEYSLDRDYTTLTWQLSETDPDGLTQREREIVDALAERGACSDAELAEAIGRDRVNTYKRLQNLTTKTIVLKMGERGSYRYTLAEKKRVS